MKNCRSSVEISPAFPAFLCLYYYLNPGGTFFPFLLASFLHEAGHGAVLLLCGAEIRKLKLGGLGASIVTGPLSWGRELAAAAAGPTVNLALGLLALHSHPPFAVVSLFLFAFNMLPVCPLDGGRMLRALLSMFFSLPAVCLPEEGQKRFRRRSVLSGRRREGKRTWKAEPGASVPRPEERRAAY